MLSLCCEGMRESESTAPLFLNSAVDGVEWLGLSRCSFAPKDRALGAHSIGGWVGLTVCVDVCRRDVEIEVKRAMISVIKQLMFVYGILLLSLLCLSASVRELLLARWCTNNPFKCCFQQTVPRNDLPNSFSRYLLIHRLCNSLNGAYFQLLCLLLMFICLCKEQNSVAIQKTKNNLIFQISLALRAQSFVTVTESYEITDLHISIETNSQGLH
jgi:hypothetical protein